MTIDELIHELEVSLTKKEKRLAYVHVRTVIMELYNLGYQIMEKEKWKMKPL